jgi:hypothetical protein
MAGRSRRFSSSSVDESEDGGNRIRCIPERTALKPTPKNLDPDDYPCFILEDTTIYLEDGKTIGNLLHADLQGSFVVRGRLLAGGELRNQRELSEVWEAGEVLTCRQ